MGTDARAAGARRGLAWYFAVLLIGSAAFEGAIFRQGDAIANHPLLVTGLMWTPALASLVARLACREPPRDVSFRFGGRGGARQMLLALGYPLVVCGVAYGIAWGTGLERFAAPPSAAPSFSGAVAFARQLGLMTTLGAVLGCITAAGEEIGWRGYMLTRLIDAGVPRPVLASGLVWAAWHVPLIVSGQYAAGRYPLLSAMLFVPSVVCAGYIAARVRLASGSVWPAVVFHGGWNAIIQGAFDRYTAGGDASHGTTLWTGESGILVVAVAVITTIVVIRRSFPLRRTPSEEGVLVRLVTM